MLTCGAQPSVSNANRKTDEDAVNGSPSDFSSTTPPAPSPASQETGQFSNPSQSAWKTEVSDRVRDRHRRTRRAVGDQPLLPGMEEALSPSSIAARVAERYSRVPSYREMLAAQAAAAEKSAAENKAAASRADAGRTSPAGPDILESRQATPRSETVTAFPEPYQPKLLRYSVSSDSLPAPRATPAEARTASAFHRESPRTPRNLLSDPLEEALIEPTLPLPAHVLASPRELVAPCKARPRLAEGPLSEAAPQTAAPADAPPNAQSLAGHRQPMPNSPAGETELRSQAPDPKPTPLHALLHEISAQTPPEWRTISLDTETPIRDPNPSPALLEGPRIHVASVEDRALAALVDCAFILSAFLLFSLIFAICTTSLPNGRPALIAAGIALFAMWVLYQLLFFSLTNATPGMRYAKIALCTFPGKNPTHPVLRRRIAAVLLSALPLGLGFLWAVFDEDGLGWHDRITQTYQRSYREP